MRFGRVAADADNKDALGSQLVHIVAVGAGLLGAAAGEVRRIEVHNDHLLADMVAGFPGLAFVVSGFEGWGLVTLVELCLALVGGSPAGCCKHDADDEEGEDEALPRSHDASPCLRKRVLDSPGATIVQAVAGRGKGLSAKSAAHPLQ